MGDTILTSIHGRRAGLSKDNDLILANGEGEILGASVVVTVPTASVLTLFSAPVTVIPAAPSGFAHLVRRAIIRKPAGTAYGGIGATEDLVFAYTGAAGAEVTGQIETTGFLDQATAQARYVSAPAASGAVADRNPVDGALVCLRLNVGDITTGTSDLIVKVWYDTINLTFRS